MADVFGSCELCGRDVHGGVRVLSTEIGEAFAVMILADPDRDWICCDACNALVCHDCCKHPDSGYCNSCYDRIFRRRRK